jgi:hypothetical protein
MNRKRDLLAFERECLTELFLESIEEGHMMSYPIYLKSSVLPKLRISDFACHDFVVFTVVSGTKI